MKGTILFFLAIILTGLYYGFQPHEEIILKGIEADIATPEYKLYIRALGDRVESRGNIIETEVPYRFTLRVMPRKENVSYVELQEVKVFACGTTTKLRSYKDPLIYVMEYFDNKKPLAYYELQGEIPCHADVEMDLLFTLRDENKHALFVGDESVTVKAYEKVPTKLGYWWKKSKLW